MASTEIVKSQKQIENEKNLIPFKKGYDPNRKPGRGRPSPLSNPDFVELFAKAVSEGLSIKELAQLFDISERTVGTYKTDMRIKSAALKYIEERIIRIDRKVTSQIEQRLEDADNLQVDELLKIRKEFLGGVLRTQTQGGKNDPATINEALTEIESDPEFAIELQQLLERQQAKS